MKAQIAERYAEVLERVAQAARRSGREPEAVTLVSVTKTWPLEVLMAAYEIGIRQFGENRAGELAEKRQEMEKRLGADLDVVWHQIGDLQSRKTATVADHADVFHALDRLKIANRLSDRMVENGRAEMPVFLEVNVSGEASKSGFHCSNWEEDGSQRENLKKAAAAVAGLPGLKPVGLMTMAPWDVSPDEIRRVFRRTGKLAEWLQTAVPQADWSQLSMGMTDDFEIAIEEGATHVRIGRAIFGRRT
ncbi:MAG: YggS family pyridoxal phosphate-dependent enzyme [Candidatus Promineifilaceae bacterium]